MLEPDGYTLLKPLWQGPNSEVHLAFRQEDDRRVVLKSYWRDQSVGGNPRALRERDAMQRVAGEGVPEVLDLIMGSGAPILVLEHVPGAPLVSWAAQGPHCPEAILTVALQVAAVLRRVHAAHLIHRDVTPNNVVVDPATLKTHLIDFGIAQPIGALCTKGSHDSVSSSGMAGTVKYMAPEQTGRMNRGVDARSDLYSLGGTMYQALTGEPVFGSDDRLALIHAHMARAPRSPRELRPDIPEALSRMVLKLLKKEPDDRYQSADSLHADLARCLEQIRATGEIDESFEPGAADVPETPVFSRALCGRDREAACLRETYARAAKGRTQVLTLHGEPGAGKSSLVDNLRSEVAATGGYLASGRFGEYAGRPYVGLASALNALVEQLLVESDAKLRAMKEALVSGLGNLLPALLELVPDLQFIVGETSPAAPLAAREARARLSLAFQRLLRTCAIPDRPLVLFLDDLHRADPESRFLLVDAVSQCSEAALLLVGSYRSDEVGAGHASEDFADELRKRGVDVDRMEIGPLTVEATGEMLAAALRRDVGRETAELADLIHRKTGGNPLLIQQLVEHLQDGGMLRREGSGWSWVAADIAGAQVPDGAVAFMTAKIDRLDPKVRSVLEFAACIGNEFDLELLCDVGDWQRDELESALYALSDAGLIAPCSAGFRFVHDRVREAARVGMGEDERSLLHYDTARLLIQRIPEDQRGDRALEIVEHLNRGRVHLTEDLRLDAVRLNHLAGKKNLSEGAAASASAHFGVGLELFRESDWAEQRPLGFQLLLDAAEGALQCGQFEPALERLADLDGRSPSRFEFTQVAVKRIQVYAVTRTPETTVKYMLSVLRKLGVRWPLHPSPLRAKLALRWVQWLLRGRSGADILRPATSVDVKWLAPILVVGQGGGTLIRHNSYLTALASCLVLRTYHRRGYIGRAPFSLASCANLVHIVLGDPIGARRLGEAASALNEQTPDPLYGPRCEMQLYSMLYPWLMRRRQPLSRLDGVAESLGEMGDVEYSYYTRFLKTCYLALAGVPIAEGTRLFDVLVDSVRRGALSYPEPEACQRAYRLLDATPTSEEIVAASGSEDAWSREHSGWARPYAGTIWLLVLCVYGHFELAFQKSSPLDQLLRITPYVHVADHTFYRGFSAGVLAARARGQQRRRCRRILRQCLRWMRLWARGGPDFVHMQMMLQAQLCHVSGKRDQATQLLTRGAKRAEEQEFLHHAALAHERHAALLVEARRFTQAAGPQSRAVACYRAWGAKAKADSLQRDQTSV